jgi:NADPH-dependent ferric siderophore reductase
MTTSPETQPMRRRRPPPRVVQVRRVTQLTPQMVRITFGGEQLDGFTSKGAAEHVRVFLPNAETGELVLPVMGPEGNEYPEGQRPQSRAYTPRRWDPKSNELDIDFVIHGDGPGSTWATKVSAGDTAVIGGQPGGAYLPETNVDWYLIAGDEAALPAMGTLLEVLPSTMRSYVFAEVLNQKEEMELASPSQLKVTWLHRDSAEALPGRKLVDMLREMELPQGNGHIWVSCEIRKHFLEERGLDRSMLRTQGYWKASASNHSDNDMGDDE